MYGLSYVLTGEFATALRKRNKVRFGFYHSFFEWFHPWWIEDHANNYKTNRFASVW